MRTSTSRPVTGVGAGPRERVLPTVAWWFVLAGTACSAAGSVGLWLRVPDSPVATFWPAAGISFALMVAAVRAGRAATIATAAGIAVATVVANLGTGAGLAVALASALASTVEPMVGAVLFVPMRRRQPSPLRFLPHLAVASVVAVLVSTIVAVMVAAPLTDVSAGSFALAWATADLLGILLVAPAVLTWLEPPLRTQHALRVPELTAQVLAMLVTAYVALGRPDVAWSLWLLLPLLMWAAIGLGPGVTAVEVAATSAAVVAATHGAQGMFGQLAAADRLITAQIGLAAIGASVLTLALFVQERQQAEQRLAASEAAAEQSRQQFELLAMNSLGLLILEDASGHIEWVSPSATAVLGWSVEDMLGKRVIDFCHLDDRTAMRGMLAVRPAGVSVAAAAPFRMSTKDGGLRWMDGRGRPLTTPTGRPGGRVLDLRDVDDHLAAQRRLAESEQRFRLATMGSAVAFVLLDDDGVIVQANQAFCAIAEVGPGGGVGRNLSDLVDYESATHVNEAWQHIRGGHSETARCRVAFLGTGESRRWGDATLSSLRGPDGTSRHQVLQIVDVTAEHHARTALEFRSQHDPLTGLANRYRLRDALMEALAAARRDGKWVAVVYLDLDHFKHVNDAHTHLGGDELLVEVAARLSGALRESDTVARVGGDEFVCVLGGLRQRSDVAVPTRAIKEAVTGEFTVRGSRVRMSASAGWALSRGDADPDDLLRNADIALYRAKAAGRNRWHAYDPLTGGEATRRLAVENDIMAGLENSEFHPWFQPIIALESGEVAGYEALVRWQHDGTWLPPADFVPVAEDSDLIVEIDHHVLRRALAQMATWPARTSVSVNMSATTLADHRLVDRLGAALAASEADPTRLVVEITETAILRLPPAGVVAVHTMRDMGIRFHVDDFGTGYSSISHLRDLPVSGIKLDRSFTAALDGPEGPAARLAEGLADLAHALGLSTVAEGVETPEQADLLRLLGWRFAQGYLFGRPAPRALDTTAIEIPSVSVDVR